MTVTTAISSTPPVPPVQPAPPVPPVAPVSQVETQSQGNDAADDGADTLSREARSVADTAKRSRASASAAGKTAARQKIDRIKTELRLMQLSGPVNPTMLAHLARELKAAVGDYTAAGGAPIDVVAVTASAMPVQEDKDKSSPEADRRAAKGQHHVDPKSPAGITPKAHAEAEPQAEGEDSPERASAGADPYRLMAEAAQARITDLARRNGDLEDRRDFKVEVTSLVGQIKTLARRAARTSADPSVRSEAEEATKAATAVEHDVEAGLGDVDVNGISLLA